MSLACQLEICCLTIVVGPNTTTYMYISYITNSILFLQRIVCVFNVAFSYWVIALLLAQNRLLLIQLS